MEAGISTKNVAANKAILHSMRKKCDKPTRRKSWVDRGLARRLRLGRNTFCHLDISAQKQRRNNRYCFIHSCAHPNIFLGALETPKNKILETNVADLPTFCCIYCVCYTSFWGSKNHGAELGFALVVNPEPPTFRDYT